MVSSSSADGLRLKEHNYLGMSDCSFVDSSTVSSTPEENKNNLNLKATELRLGLPGSQSPKRDPCLSVLSSVKLDEKLLLGGNVLSKRSSGTQSASKTEVEAKASQECSHKINGSNTTSPLAAKAQVVGWPPIRSYRKNTLATTSKNNDEVDGKPGPGALFVKVSMDGAPYLRKVDLRSYATYQELCSALEKMFSCFTIGSPSREMMSESRLRDLPHGSEYVLTFEDKDGDWMLVGDVPWDDVYFFMQEAQNYERV
ncbi:hypothetical protein OROMI_028629 [Orobanche minor]